MKLYNTLTKKKEEFKSQKLDTVLMYNCGPTVYNYAHIGNLRTYVNVDLLRRFLIHNRYKVKQVTNITDIEDKIIREAGKAGVEYTEYTKKYEKAFFEDLSSLNIEKSEYYPHATDPKVIGRMIEIIQGLLDKGFAYKSEDGSIYFTLSKFPNYGKLSGAKRTAAKSESRIDSDEYDKDNVMDFALWKAKKEGEPSFRAPFGDGRPGWHIECSAMSTMLLGDTIDIHAGGVDLIFPHHENEIAQSEAFTGKKFVNYWFHGEMLLVEGRKMSKSLHNMYTLEEMSKKFEVEPLAFRMLCIMSHYRDKLNFTHSSIVDAQNTLNNLRHFVLKLQLLAQKDGKVSQKSRFGKLLENADQKFEKSLADDLAMPKAMSYLFEFIKEFHKEKDYTKRDAEAVLRFIMDIDKVLGLNLDQVKVDIAPNKVQTLAVGREDARKAGDYDKADKLRKKIEDIGYLIEDTTDGPVLRKK